MHFYKFNIGDYASHTRHLSPLEDIAYRRLLDLAYTTEQPLTKNIHQLSRLINMRDYEQEISDVVVEFFTVVEEGFIHNRVLKEIEAAGDRSEKAKQSVGVRWKKKRKADVLRMNNELNTDVKENNTGRNEKDTTHYPLHTTHYTLPETGDQLPITQDSKSKTRSKTIAPMALLAALEIPEALALDFSKLRAAKKAPITKTALDGIAREALKANITLLDAITVCCERGWGGFKAEWFFKDGVKVIEKDGQAARVSKLLFGEKNEA